MHDDHKEAIIENRRLRRKGIIHSDDCVIVRTLAADKKIDIRQVPITVSVFESKPVGDIPVYAGEKCIDHYSGLNGICERCGKP